MTFVFGQAIIVSLIVLTLPLAIEGRTSQLEARRKLAVELCVQGDEMMDRAAAHGDGSEVLLAKQALWTSAIEKFQEASRIWREIGDVKREALAIERMRILYENLDEYVAAMGLIDREIEVWKVAGNKALHARRLCLRAGRTAMHDKKLALEYYKQCIDIARSGQEYGELWQALYEIVSVYRELGDEAAAKLCEAELKLVREKHESNLDSKLPNRSAVSRPSNWVDLPSSPLKSDERQLNGQIEAGLVSHSSKNIGCYTIGCIVVESSRVRVMKIGPEVCVYDGAYTPGQFVHYPFEWIASPVSDWSDELPACTEGARWAVVEVRFSDGSIWSAAK